ncbi:MAG: ThuA domain-containing protein, partial [Halioglobus sp.]
MSILNKLAITLVLLLIASCAHEQISWRGGTDQLLVFSKTSGYRHGSIETGGQALITLGLESGFHVTVTEEAGEFTLGNLQQYAAVVFLNTTGDVLDPLQQSDFEQYIRGGGGFVGIHAATDTEYEWPWYGKLVGAYFDSHPEIQEASLRVIDKNHPSTASLEDSWQKTDEWYNFKAISPDITVLVELDEHSYSGGTNGGEHPISWYQEYDGGRAFYTAMGHTKKSYKNPVFLRHLLGGIAYAMGDDTLVAEMPDEIEFVRTVLDLNLDEPMELDELPGEGILFVERRGAIKLYDFADETTKKVAQLEVF